MVHLFASLVSSQIKLASTILVFNFFCCDFKNAEECLVIWEFISQRLFSAQHVSTCLGTQNLGRVSEEYRTVKASLGYKMRLHLEKKEKKQTREKIIPHPLNVSVSREDPGGRDQMGISEAEFLARGKKMMAVQERKEEQRESWKSTRMLRPATQRQQWRLGPAKHKHQPGSKSPSYRHVSPLLWFLPTPVWVSYVTQTRWNSNSWFSILDADSNHIKSGVVFAGLVKAAILLWVHGCRLCHIQGYQLAAGALILF